MKLPNTIAAAALAALAALPCGARQTTMMLGTVRDFDLPRFDKDTGAKQWELFGDSATYVDDSRIDIKKLKLDLYENSAEQKIRATVKSPDANVNPEAKSAQSQSEIFVSGAEFDMSGRQWRWNGAKNFVEVFSNVEISVKRKSSSGRPIAFKSSYASLDYSGGSNVFELKKSVFATDGEMKLSCEFLHAKSDKKNSRGLSEITASGAVKILRDGRESLSENASIDPAKGLAELWGNPSISDIASGATLGGGRIILDTANRKVESLSKGKTRAKATIFHAEENGSKQKIEILADKITMSSEGEKNVFDFSGSVKIFSDDFSAACDKLRALASNGESGKPKVESVKGSGNVAVKNSDGTARGKNMEIIPERSEIILTGGASLKNDERGMELKSQTMVFYRAKNSGLAVADPNDKNSFVVATMNESPSLSDAAAGKAAGGKKSKSVIKARRLDFERADKNMDFLFSKDVSILSDEIEATCQNMKVFVEHDERGAANAKKIVARESVAMRHKGCLASAETAVIYPRLGGAKGAAGQKKIHKFVELSTDPQNPGLRPTITLPPIKNIGIKDSDDVKVKPAPTVIKSDKQWLASSPASDRYFFQGDVEVVSSDLRAECGKGEVVIRAKNPNAQKEITQIIMTENVKLEQDLKEVRCGRADIYPDEEMAILSENPIVVNREDNSRATGHRIVYNKGARTIAVESDPEAYAPKPAAPAFQPPDEDESEDSAQNARPKIKLPMRKR